ncbi:nucleotidyltransferase domain-containing protein [Haliovirga abyssi]|uniref:Polymerase beta nucleotidyltransferase domain-containing protein n=1 Tax=Haliovirga abyssi TaxID=2996794 RepID=A0AAU9DGK8_9FUSO|nr:nucleotidyltransferase domain-containing protein [Haliovirga abyssi]BDU51398.1 hypothetical protein HLVA_19670 [Haliovirga abyssi]
MKYGLREKIIEELFEIFQENDKIKEVILFGSRAKGNFKNGSDIDLAIKGKNLNLVDLNKLLLKIDELDLPYEIDIIIYDKIKNIDLLEHIDRVGIALYKYKK